MTSELSETDKHNRNEISGVTPLLLNQVTNSSALVTPKTSGDKILKMEQGEEESERSASDEEVANINAAVSSEVSTWDTMQMSASTSSGSTESTVSCRICKAHGGQDLVLSPCNCKGSMGVVHVSCLEQWLTGSVRDSCELCSVRFNISRTRQYTCARSLWVYLRNHVSFPRLLRDLFFLSVSLMNTTVLVYMWLIYVFRDAFTSLSNGHMVNKSAITNPLRSMIYLFFFTLCLVFVFVNTLDDFRRVVHFYALPWYRWWQSCVDVKLVVQQNTTEKPKQE